MTIEFLWQLPASGDGRSPRQEQWTRGDYTPAIEHRPVFARTDVRRDGYTWYDHLAQVARAAELSGFNGVLIPQTPAGEEPWIVAGAIARDVKRLALVPSLPAPFLSAVYAAKMAVSFQRLTGGRLAWNLITEEPAARAWHGHRWSVVEQIARTDEFLDVVKGVWNEAPFTYHGSYYEVENGGFSPALARLPGVARTTSDGVPQRGPIPTEQPLPTIYWSGESEEALAFSAKHADVHFLPLDTLAATRARIETLSARAAIRGRTLRFAIQADVVARHETADAWQYLQRRWNDTSGKTVSIDAAQSAPSLVGTFDDYIVDDHIWSGFGVVRAGAPAGLVGSYAELAARIEEYAQAGVSVFALAANPHLEEAYTLGTQLLPLVRGRVAQQRRLG